MEGTMSETALNRLPVIIDIEATSTSRTNQNGTTPLGINLDCGVIITRAGAFVGNKLIVGCSYNNNSPVASGEIFKSSHVVQPAIGCRVRLDAKIGDSNLQVTSLPFPTLGEEE